MAACLTCTSGSGSNPVGGCGCGCGVLHDLLLCGRAVRDCGPGVGEKAATGRMSARLPAAAWVLGWLARVVGQDFGGWWWELGAGPFLAAVRACLLDVLTLAAPFFPSSGRTWTRAALRLCGVTLPCLGRACDGGWGRRLGLSGRALYRPHRCCAVHGWRLRGRRWSLQAVLNVHMCIVAACGRACWAAGGGMGFGMPWLRAVG